MILARLIAKVLTPRSYCDECGHPFFSDVRRPCRCGAMSRVFGRGLSDRMGARDRSKRRVA